MHRPEIWFILPWVDDAFGKKVQAELENRVLQNDKEYILDFLAGVPKVQIYIGEHCKVDKEVTA